MPFIKQTWSILITFYPEQKNPKLCSWNAIKVQLPHFLSPTEALEGTLFLVMNLLCIVSNFDIKVWSSRSHFKGCFYCPKTEKPLNPHISKTYLAPMLEIPRTRQNCSVTLFSVLPSHHKLMHLSSPCFYLLSNSHTTNFSPDDFFIVVDKSESQRFASHKCTGNPKLSPYT